MNKRNYMSGEEKLFLQELVGKYKNIIENKKTDCITAAEKKKAWLGLTKEFNSLAENSSRSVEQLRKCWENMKSRRKTELAEEKRERMATGGGPFKTPTSDKIDGLLDIVDIEIKDSVDSDTNLHNTTREYELDENFVLHSVDFDDVEVEPQPGPSTAPAPARTSTQMIPPERKNWYRSRGSAVEAELEIRLQRIKMLMKQETEIHNIVRQEKLLKVEEQQIRVRIAEEDLKQLQQNE